MKDCEYLVTCPIFSRFSSEGVKNIWISLYCKGPRQQECARKKLREAVKEVSLDLLPNGKLLGSTKD